jgi:hypothetical protein
MPQEDGEPTEMDREGMSEADRLLSRRLAIDRLDRQRDFNELPLLSYDGTSPRSKLGFPLQVHADRVERKVADVLEGPAQGALSFAA